MITMRSTNHIYKQRTVMPVNLSSGTLMNAVWITTTLLVCSVNFYVVAVMFAIDGANLASHLHTREQIDWLKNLIATLSNLGKGCVIEWNRTCERADIGLT